LEKTEKKYITETTGKMHGSTALPFVVWFCGKIDTLNKTEDSKFCQQIN
jgi:hypothetical protein